MTLKTFLFDLGNVLLYFSHEKMCEQVGALCGKSGAEIRELMLQNQKILDIDRGTLSNDEMQAWLEAETATTFDREELLIALSDIFVPNTPLIALLDELKSRGFRLVLLSNTNAFHIEFVRRNFDVLEKFDHLTLSFEVGAVKPDAAIYQAACRAIDCAPEECFYTDDIPEYVEAARGHGLSAGVFTSTESFVHQVKEHGPDLSDLL
ncbi:MAG: HAD family phosphatase [Planctomycetaceae bacterium]|nr:HAD family phosphatase [Planctomycetaceae bacterium]